MCRIGKEWFGRAIVSLVVLLILGIAYISQTHVSTQSFEIDTICELRRVVDGDTIDTFPCGRIRFADINAPEIYTLEGEKAMQALEDVLSRYGPKLYLDVDDIYVIDRYNRIVAVVYVRYNSTHLLNINLWMVINGYAEITDYYNEFNPYRWSLYVYYPTSMEIAPKTVTVVSPATVTSTVTSPVTLTETTTVTSPVTVTATSPVTVTVTSPITLTKTTTVPFISLITLTKTTTTPRTFTTIVPTTITTTHTTFIPTTVMITREILTAIPITATITTTMTKTITSILTSVSPSTVVDWTTLTVLAMILLIIGFVIGYMVKRGRT